MWDTSEHAQGICPWQRREGWEGKLSTSACCCVFVWWRWAWEKQMSPFQICLNCSSLTPGTGAALFSCSVEWWRDNGAALHWGSSLGGHFLRGREWVLWLLLSHTFYQGHVKNWRQFSRSLCKAVEKPNPLFLRPFQGPLQPMRSASDASVLDVWTCLGISCGYFLI